MPPLPITDLGIQVSSARLWAEGAVPRSGGGWNWIGQMYNFPQENPTEWVVMHLETGLYTIYVDTTWEPKDRGRYVASSSYHKLNKGLRASNDRVFWPAISTWWWYYEPTTGVIYDMGRAVAVDASLYQMIFNHDGSKIYGGTQTANNSPGKMPAVVEFDPHSTPPTSTFMCRVGSTGRTQSANYAYSLWADGNYLYVMVGEEFWDVVAVNLTTFTQTIIRTTGANSWAYLEEVPGQGLTCRITVNNVTTERFWLYNGADAGPYTIGVPPPFTPHDVTKYSNPTTGTPQIDSVPAPTGVNWRPNGSSAPYTFNEFAIDYAGPVNIDAICTLPSLQILGSSEQYQGWFRYDPSSGNTTFYGEWVSSIAEVAFCNQDISGKVYFTGYPNGVLYEYDPSADWLVTGPAASQNPKKLGNYSNGVSFSGVKRGRVLRYSSTYNRMFMVGERDRSGDGGGIGYYDFGTKAFGGTFTGLEAFSGPLGLACFDALDRYVMGGQNAPGELVLYNHNLAEVDRQIPIVGLTDTGQLFRTNEAQVVVGYSKAGSRIYRWNIVTETLLGQVDLSSYGACRSPCTQLADGTLTVIAGSTVLNVNLVTLAITELGTLSDPLVSTITARTNDYYMGLGANLLFAGSEAPSHYEMSGQAIGALVNVSNATMVVGTSGELDAAKIAVAATIGSASFTVTHVMNASAVRVDVTIHSVRTPPSSVIIDLPEVLISLRHPIADIDLPPPVVVFDGPLFGQGAQDARIVELPDPSGQQSPQLERGLALTLDTAAPVAVLSRAPGQVAEVATVTAVAPESVSDPVIERGVARAVESAVPVAVIPRAPGEVTEVTLFRRRTIVPTEP